MATMAEFAGTVYFKPGVTVTNVQLQVLWAMYEAGRLMNGLYRQPLTVTSVSDGEHMAGSLHYRGRAFDLRIWGLREPKHYVVALAAVLGPEWDVVLEADHIHVEWDLKPKVSKV